MFEGNSIIGTARLVAALGIATVMLAMTPLYAAHAAQHAGAKPTASDEAETPIKIHDFLVLLADPSVQKWLEKQDLPAAAPAHAKLNESVSHYFDDRLGAIREHIVGLYRAVPALPNEFGAAIDRLEAAIPVRGTVLFLVLVFAGLGFGVEWLFRKVTQKTRRRLDGLPMETVNDRLRLLGARFAFAFGMVAAFAIGSVGPFLAFDWPSLLRETVFGYLVAFLLTRIAVLVGKFLLAPDAERFRIIPADRVAARFWCRRLTLFVGWYAFGWMTLELLTTLGFSMDERELVGYPLALGLVAIALESVWRRPTAPDQDAAEAGAPMTHRLGRGAQNAVLSAGIVLLWGLWVAGAKPGFWLVLVIIALPVGNRLAQGMIEHLLRPPGLQVDDDPPSVITVCIERGLRAVLIVGAAAVLAWGWGVDLVSLAGDDTRFARLAHGALSAVIILLVTDVFWHATKAAIDRKLADSVDLGLPNSDAARRRARLRTLLPIFRNILFVVVVAVAALMVLAAMGVEIGPVIAGLSVLGVAIGFGAQNFVRDIIAGMFYLLDDAFRVGEYIQSGNYKGTVESFSIRSVRLRHQRGAIYTVPFALLGAVQNMSRDWVVDKLSVGITYDSDIERARKLIKQIGLELAEDPEFAPVTIQPLKMQGVNALSDCAVELIMKMMTLPGENFPIRRKAFAMIKAAFDANGIKFAFPTVQIAGDVDHSAAATAGAAQRALHLTQPAAAE